MYENKTELVKIFMLPTWWYRINLRENMGRQQVDYSFHAYFIVIILLFYSSLE